ncbi:MAG: rhodanese-like domain-containing protein [Fibrobacterales bacterium]
MSYLDDIKEEIADGTAQLVDVREQEEWDAGHVAGALFAPLTQLNQDVIPDSLDKTKKLYLYCRSGARVQMAAPVLEEHGFEEVEPLAEGFVDLISLGFEQA